MNPGIDSPSHPGRVLVVDDEKALAQMIATYLSRAGYTVDQAHTGPAALEAARNQHPDVVVLDLGLPGLTGSRCAVPFGLSPSAMCSYSPPVGTRTTS